MAESVPAGDGDETTPSLGALQFSDYLGAGPCRSGSSCPPEYANLSARELIAQIDAERQRRATATAGETLAAGFLPRAPATSFQQGSGFESGGVLDVCAPSGSLAGLTDAVTRDGRLPDLDDDELIGVLRAWHRLESWCASGALAAIAELARRRPADGTTPASPGNFPDQLSEFIGDEVAAALTLTGRAADTCLGMALDLEIRLPGTARALHEGIIDRPRARLIAEATQILTDEHAHQVEARILPAAARQTTGQLRAALARAVLAVDPEAAARRREEAQKDPRVRRWQEDAGTAALAGYSLPPADVLAADQRITARAHALRDAGLPGTLEQLRARAYLDALLGQDSTPPAEPDRPAAEPDRPAASGAAPAQPAARPPASWPAKQAPANQPLAARVNLTLPLLTGLGLAAEPGSVAGFGPVDPALARDLAARATATRPAASASRSPASTESPSGTDAYAAARQI